MITSFLRYQALLWSLVSLLAILMTAVIVVWVHNGKPPTQLVLLLSGVLPLLVWSISKVKTYQINHSINNNGIIKFKSFMKNVNYVIEDCALKRFWIFFAFNTCLAFVLITVLYSLGFPHLDTGLWAPIFMALGIGYGTSVGVKISSSNKRRN